MLLKQYYLGCLAHASYLIADEAARVGVVVDPQRDIDQYLDDARRYRLEIRHVFLTHFHADFVAGHLELRSRTGAAICLGARARADYEFTPMKDGQAIEFGAVQLVTLETPGHSPESISIVVYDLAKSASAPHAVLTGDTLFIGDVGRPDLRASLGWPAAELGRMLYGSLRRKLLALPDDTLVYPAHGAGSMCGKNISSDTVSTIGAQRRHNYALQPMTEEEFVRLVTSDQPEAPEYFTYDAVLNASERPTLDESLARGLKPLTLEETLRIQNAGAQVLDVREPGEFASVHLLDAINIGLGGKYATWAGTLLGRDRPIVIVAAPGREVEAATRLGRIGFDHVAGYLEGGMAGVGTRADLLRRTERVTASALAERLAANAPPPVIDVRAPREWADKRIAGSVNLPLNHLAERIAEASRGREVVVHCQSGYRSSIAASLMAQRGIEAVELAGGIAAWEASGLPVCSSAARGAGV